ncbi:hypothetical protein [Qipengyuania aquimaris]|nr:hypothetical protein [Qipengyuania aquimaris]
MPRFANHIVAVFAAVTITVLSMQTIVSVPTAQLAVVETPAIA